MKSVANEIFGIFEKYKSGQCSYDRALEDASNIIKKRADERPIVGYVKSGALKEVLSEIYRNKEVNKDRSYMFDFQLHQNQMELLKRMLDS